jgi:NADH pyrophosphatase NudC (nudix superfamily)
MRGWRFCPRCGIGLTFVGDGPERHATCGACGFVKYDNPLPTTIGLICRGRTILLLRRADEPARGRWDTVGGFLSGGETAEQNLVREAREEIGCPVVDLRPVGSYSSVYGDTGMTTVGIAFRCRIADDAVIRLSDENSEHGWFGWDEIPDLAFADVAQAVRDLVDGVSP